VAAVLVAAPVTAEPAFPPLKTGALRDCGTPEAVPTYCRIRRVLSAEEARERLCGGTLAIWAEGDVVSVVAKAPGDAVRVAGAVSGPLGRIAGTDLWSISVRTPSLDAALLDAFVFNGTGGPVVYKEWRGPSAEPKPPVVETLTGASFVVDISSPNLGETRKVSVYLPPAFDSARRYPVIYVADGGNVRALSKQVEHLILAGEAPPLVMVGLHNGGDERRSQDYLIGWKGSSDGFAKHERFFLQEVMPRAEKAWGASNQRSQRMLMGHSNGAAWAVDTALRNPTLFGAVFATSVGWGERKTLGRTESIRFFLAAGELERSFRRKTGQLADALAGAGHLVTFKPVVAGHSRLMEEVLLDDAIAMAFPLNAGPSAARR
jgi:hypothetical protein